MKTKFMAVGILIAFVFVIPTPQGSATIYIGSDTVLTADIYDKVVITADGITLDCDGYSIIGSGWHTGILLDNRNNVTIKNCVVENFMYGMEIIASSNNTISNNIVSNNDYGIYLYSSSSNTISNNNASNNDYGIHLFLSSNDNTISNNDIYSSHYHGIYIGESLSNTISNNNASNNSAGIRLVLVSNNTISNNDIYLNRWAGILITSSSSNTISNNNVSNNSDGILLGTSSNNTISNNDIYSNIDEGILITSSSNDNTIYHNNIINNGMQVSTDNPSANNWHHPVLLEGNYWSDYTGTDDGSGSGKHAIAGDEIGDTLIPHPTTDYDFYPFMSPDGWLENQAEVAIVEIDDYIQDIDDDAFKNNAEQRKNALSNKLEAVMALIDAGEYQDAINKLKNDIRSKCDGSLGGNPKNDWITDPDVQAELCAMIDALIAYLETLP